MMAHHQWSGIDKEDVDRWMNNFTNLSDEVKKLALTILINIIYYSETDIISALKHGIYNLLFKDLVLKRQIDLHFSLSPKALSNIITEELDSSCFIPLLDKNAPHESGNSISRLLVQNNIINADQSIFLHDIKIDSKYKRIVIIDDCVGSGDQLIKFWNENAKIKKDNSDILLKDACLSIPNLIVNYLTLFGYRNSIKELQEKLNGLEIYCVNFLSNANRVFSDESYVWQNDELVNAKEKIRELVNERGIPLLGYKDLDFAFIMNKTIPDWSLPMFYMETSDWSPLLRRKSTI